jgi:phage tail protein X
MRTFSIERPDSQLRAAIQDKIDNLNKPKGSLGVLEELAMQICLVQQTLSPALLHRLFEHLEIGDKANSKELEITMECNPDDITEDFAEACRSRFWIWPALPSVPDHFHKAPDSLSDIYPDQADSEILTADSFTEYITDEAYRCCTSAVFEKTSGITDSGDCSKEAAEVQSPDRSTYRITVNNIDITAEETYLMIQYTGDHAGMFHNGAIVADSFYTGQIWETGILRFLENDRDKAGEDNIRTEFSAEIAITPLYENSEKYLEIWPEMNEGRACGIDDISITTIYRKAII